MSNTHVRSISFSVYSDEVLFIVQICRDTTKAYLCFMAEETLDNIPIEDGYMVFGSNKCFM